MNKYLFIATALLLSVSFVQAEEGDFSVGVNFGEHTLVGSGMNQFGTNALLFGGYLLFSPSDLFDLDLNFNYAPHSSGANKIGAFSGTTALRFAFAFDQLLPFITAGVGFYRNSATLSGVTSSATGFGFNFGGGMDVEIGSNFRLGLLARYHPVFNKAGILTDFFDVMLRIGFVFKTGIQGGWD